MFEYKGTFITLFPLMIKKYMVWIKRELMQIW